MADQNDIKNQQVFNNEIKEYRSLLKEITGELGNQRSSAASAVAEYRQMDSIARQLQDTETGISNLTSKQIENLRKKYGLSIREVEAQASMLQSEKVRGKLTEDKIKHLQETSKLTDKEAALLKGKLDDFKLEKDFVEQINKELKTRITYEQKVSDLLGVSGAVVGGIDAVMTKLGINSGIFKAAIEESTQAMHEAADEAVRQGEAISKTRIMLIGLAPLAKGFSKALFDPLTITTKILDTYFDINKASVNVERLTGQNAVTAAGWNTSLASAKDYLETVSELTKQTGFNAQNAFSQDVLAGAAELKVTMGLAADEAGGIAIMAQTSGRSVDNITKSVVGTTSAFNKANRSAVSQGVVLKEVAKASDSIKLSLANNPESLAKAAAAATRLGMSLQDVDNIASSLLNFQDSISNELEAELLIGRDLNLEKARELALSNDLKGLGDELFKNASDITEFGKMNRIQQEAEAKALGMTRDQLAKIAYQKAIEKGLTDEQAAAAANVNAEDMKRISAQENFSKALEKIAGAVAPILDVIGSILSLPLAPYLLIGVALSGKMLSNFSGIFNSIKGVAGGAKDMVAGLGKGAADKGVEGVAGGITGAADKTKGIQKGAGANVKEFLINVGEGLLVFGEAMIAGGWAAIAALAVSAISLGAALRIAAPGIEAFGTVVTAVFAGLGTLVTSIADGFVKLIEAVSMDNIAPMLLLGPALFGIAAGLGALGLASFTAIPAIAGLVTLAAVAPALTTLATAVSGATTSSVGESKTKADEGSLAAVEAKLSELVAVVRAGGNVYLDSNKVGRAQVLGSYKSA